MTGALLQVPLDAAKDDEQTPAEVDGVHDEVAAVAACREQHGRACLSRCPSGTRHHGPPPAWWHPAARSAHGARSLVVESRASTTDEREARAPPTATAVFLAGLRHPPRGADVVSEVRSGMSGFSERTTSKGRGVLHDVRRDAAKQ